MPASLWPREASSSRSDRRFWPPDGYSRGMEREVDVRDIEEVSGRSGTTRFVLRDDEGNEYTTFRPQIGRDAMRFKGKRAVITFHEEERRGFRNVYLDSVTKQFVSRSTSGV